MFSDGQIERKRIFRRIAHISTNNNVMTRGTGSLHPKGYRQSSFEGKDTSYNSMHIGITPRHSMQLHYCTTGTLCRMKVVLSNQDTSRALTLHLLLSPISSSSSSRNYRLLLVVQFDIGRGELPSRHFTVEQNIDLSVRSVLEFRKTEVCHHETENSRPSPDESTFSAKVPTGRVEHLTGQVDTRDFDGVVEASAYSGRQRTKTDRRGL
jgi:hypothetical protein